MQLRDRSRWSSSISRHFCIRFTIATTPMHRQWRRPPPKRVKPQKYSQRASQPPPHQRHAKHWPVRPASRPPHRPRHRLTIASKAEYYQNQVHRLPSLCRPIELPFPCPVYSRRRLHLRQLSPSPHIRIHQKACCRHSKHLKYPTIRAPKARHFSSNGKSRPTIWSRHISMTKTTMQLPSMTIKYPSFHQNRQNHLSRYQYSRKISFRHCSIQTQTQMPIISMFQRTHWNRHYFRHYPRQTTPMWPHRIIHSQHLPHSMMRYKISAPISRTSQTNRRHRAPCPRHPQNVKARRPPTKSITWICKSSFRFPNSHSHWRRCNGRATKIAMPSIRFKSKFPKRRNSIGTARMPIAPNAIHRFWNRALVSRASN